MQNWLLHVLHNLDSTKHLGKLHDSWMDLGVCCHIDEFQEFAHMANEMQVYVFQVFRNVDEITQFMSPSWQALFLYNFLNLILNQMKPHQIDAVSFH